MIKSFAALGVSAPVVEALARLGIRSPFAVQALVLPDALAGVDVLAASLFARFRSRRDHTFGEKVLSAMRYQFGGHTERPAGA